MELIPTALPEVVEVVPPRHGDRRGWFSEVYRPDLLTAAGLDISFVQDNESFSAPRGTLRGIHYQIEPFPQAKLVRVLAGSILDVVVDLRRDSTTFGRHVTITLSAERGNQIFVPVGFGHGLLTLEPNTHVAYKVSSRYAPEYERAIRWNDPDLAVGWPVDVEPTLSDKDAVAPLLAEQPDLFDLPPQLVEDPR